MINSDIEIRNMLREFVLQVAVLEIYYRLLRELNPPLPPERNEIMKTVTIFPRAVRIAVYSHVVLGFSKLFYKRDDDTTLHTLVNRTYYEYKYLSLDRNKLSKKEVGALQTDLKGAVVLIEKTIAQRNKYVAHNDKAYFGQPGMIAELTLEFREMTELLKLAIKIVDSINNAYDQMFIFRGAEQAKSGADFFFDAILDQKKWIIEEERRDIAGGWRRAADS